MSEPKRYNEEMVNISNGDPCGEIEFDYSASMVEAFEGRWVAWEDYAELKAEAERYRLASLRVDVSELHAQFNRALFDDTIAENARLKAEVERLTERLGGVRLIVTEEMYDELNTKYLEQQHELQNIALTARQILDEKIDLKEQVERLTKAGDAMVDMVDWEVPYERRKKLEADWNAAKEGKQS